MTVWGFCIEEQADVVIDADRRCLYDHSLTIAPTWGKRTQVWRDGNWSPAIERPEGYVYRAPVFPEPKLKPEPVPPAPRKRAKKTPTLTERLLKRPSQRADPEERTCKQCGVLFMAVSPPQG